MALPNSLHLEAANQCHDAWLPRSPALTRPHKLTTSKSKAETPVGLTRIHDAKNPEFCAKSIKSFAVKLDLFKSWRTGCQLATTSMWNHGRQKCPYLRRSCTASIHCWSPRCVPGPVGLVLISICCCAGQSLIIATVTFQVWDVRYICWTAVAGR